MSVTCRIPGCFALSGLLFHAAPIPRALPWATISLPLWGEPRLNATTIARNHDRTQSRSPPVNEGEPPIRAGYSSHMWRESIARFHYLGLTHSTAATGAAATFLDSQPQFHGGASLGHGILHLAPHATIPGYPRSDRRSDGKPTDALPARDRWRRVPRGNSNHRIPKTARRIAL